MKDPAHGEFTARGDRKAGPDNWYGAKSDIDYQLWTPLNQVTTPERLGTGNVQ
jgi:hypothetical protein